MVSKVCHSQLSSSTLARAAHMPPWAAPVQLGDHRRPGPPGALQRRPQAGPPGPDDHHVEGVLLGHRGLLGFAGCDPESEAISAPGSVARYLHAPRAGLWKGLVDCRGRCLLLT